MVEQVNDWYAIAYLKNNKCKQEFFSELVLHTKFDNLINSFDTYVSQNCFKIPKRNCDNVSKINKLYIDLDCYTTSFSKDDVVFALQENIFEIPIPSEIIDSGRGLYLKWNIIPVDRSYLKLWYQIETYLADTLQDLGADKKCCEPARILRIEGTLNSKTNTKVQVIFASNKIYDLDEDSFNLPTIKPKINPVKSKTTINPKANGFTLHTLNYARIKDLEKLCELRNWNLTGHREVICFLYRYIQNYFIKDPSEALKRTLELNSKFNQPLSQKEVIKTTKSAETRYLNGLEDQSKKMFTNEYIISALGITMEEQYYLKTIISKRELYDRWNMKKNMMRRNKVGLTKKQQEQKNKIIQIKDLLRQGLNLTQISNELNLSKQLINYLIKK